MSHYKVKPATPPKGRGWFVSMIAALAVTAFIFAIAPRHGVPASAESYDLCTVEPDYGNAPCVVLSLVDGKDGYTWVSKDSAGVLAFVDMLPCASDDGPAPCVWDTRRGNGQAHVTMRRFVMIRD